MELNLKMEDEQKKQMFDDWWRASFDAIEKSNFTHETLGKSIETDKSMRMKENFSAFAQHVIQHCGHNMIIFSAGITQTITEKLRMERIPLEKVTIIANDVDYQTKRLKNSEMITSYTKNSHLIPKAELSESTEWFVVIGDSHTDHEMLLNEHVKPGQKALKVALINLKQKALKVA